MEPWIQYAPTADGVNIAFSMLGDGTPFVMAPAMPWSHLGLDWQFPEYRGWLERLAKRRKVIRYNHRGTGLSDRSVTDFSLEALLADLDAVVTRLGLERFALYGVGTTGAVAIAYAVRHPERVSHLILWCTWAAGADYYTKPPVQALAALRPHVWEIYTRTVANVMVAGWSDGARANQVASYLRECVSQDTARRIHEVNETFDVSDVLPQVRCPTLVLHRRQFQGVHVENATKLAAGIPNAWLTVLEGESPLPFEGDVDAVLSTVDDFLSRPVDAPSGERGPLPEGMAVILFTDIADSTSLTEELGDSAFHEREEELDRALRWIIDDSGGKVVEGKLLGDGVMAEYRSARQAVEGAVRCKWAGEERSLSLHLGIHAGDIVRKGIDISGGAVNVAARICGVSVAGEILLSDTVRALARTSSNFEFEDRGDQDLKGVDEPVHLYAVRLPSTDERTHSI